MSFPALSAPWAMRDYPQARDAELDALLERAELAPGMVVVDLQAAGGYVADTIHRHLHGRVRCLCVEPSPLGDRIHPRHRHYRDPIDAMTSIADGEADRVVGLAGLHHSPDVPASLAEVYRILRPGGAFAVCDVEAGGAMDAWLNGFVDRHNPAGHKGRFFAAGELTALLRGAGFQRVTEQRQEVPWRFASLADAVRFFQGLFGLASDADETLAAMQELLWIDERRDGVSIGWYMIYATGWKAHG